MAWMSLDPTTLCVIFLIITLSALWVYVSMRNEGAQQPNFSLLHEVTQKTTTTGNTKGPKTKGRKKMVDGGSPKPSHISPKGVLKKSSTGASKGKAVGPSETSGEDEAKTREERKRAGHKVTVKEKQVQPSKHKPSVRPRDSGGSSGGGVGGEESGTSNEEGEWQTQLSRPQLKALRQKQRQSEKKIKGRDDSAVSGELAAGLVPSSGRPTAVEATDSQFEARAPHLVATPPVSSELGKRKKNKKRAPPSSSSEDKTTSSSDDRGVEESNYDFKSTPHMEPVPPAERPDSSSPELHVTLSVPAGDMETALVEAAGTIVSSIEEDNALPDTAATTITTTTDASTKKSKRRKKPRKQVKPADVSPEPATQSLVHARPGKEDLPVQQEEQQAEKEAIPAVQEQETQPSTETKTVPAQQEAMNAEVDNDQEEWVFITKDM